MTQMTTETEHTVHDCTDWRDCPCHDMEACPDNDNYCGCQCGGCETQTTTIHHPVSGEKFAVRMDKDGTITEAAGPLHYSDATDQDSLEGWLQNNSETSRDDGEWLNREIELSG